MGKVSAINIKDIAKDFLRSYGISPSVQRFEILSFMLVSNFHPSVDEIYAHLKDSLPTLSKTTVYNTLKLFVKEGLITTLNIAAKEERYDVAVKKHAHFLCSECGKIFDIESEDILKVLSSNVIKDNEIDYSVINFIGKCTDCK